MNKKTLVIGLVALLVLANIAVFVFLFVNNKKAQIQTALVAQQEEERERKEKELKEEREAVEKGWIKMISGDVVRLDGGNRSLVVDIDPLGKHQEYEIVVSGDTVFEKKTAIQVATVSSEEQIAPEGDKTLYSLQNETAHPPLLESAETSYSEIKEGQFIEVHFAKRMDLENAPELVAEKIVVYEYDNYEENN